MLGLSAREWKMEETSNRHTVVIMEFGGICSLHARPTSGLQLHMEQRRGAQK